MMMMMTTIEYTDININQIGRVVGSYCGYNWKRYEQERQQQQRIRKQLK
jgi:hypothetical protein